MARADITASIVLNSLAILANLIAIMYYMHCLAQKKHKEASFQQLTVHILAFWLAIVYIVTTANRIDTVTWGLSQIFQIMYFLAAIWYYSTIMTALSFLGKQSYTMKLGCLSEKMTGKFYQDVGILLAGVISLLFMGRFVILFKDKPDTWMSIWYALSEFGSILFNFSSLCVAIDVAAKLTNMSRHLNTLNSFNTVGFRELKLRKNTILGLLMVFAVLYLMIVVIGCFFTNSNFVRPIASALGGLGAVLFSLVFELVIKYYYAANALDMQRNPSTGTITTSTIVTVS